MDFIRDKILNIGEKELKLDNLGEDVVVEKEQPIQEKEQEIEIEEEVNPAPAAQQEAEEEQSKEILKEQEKDKILEQIEGAKDSKALDKIYDDLPADLKGDSEIQTAIEKKKKYIEEQNQEADVPPKKEEKFPPAKSFLEDEDDKILKNIEKQWSEAVYEWNGIADKILAGNEQIFSGLNEILMGILKFSLDPKKASSEGSNRSEGGTE